MNAESVSIASAFVVAMAVFALWVFAAVRESCARELRHAHDVDMRAPRAHRAVLAFLRRRPHGHAH